jgi:hypothetical protein
MNNLEYDKNNKIIKLIKYLLFMLCTFLILRYLPNHKISINELLYISLSNGILFIIIDYIAKERYIIS